LRNCGERTCDWFWNFAEEELLESLQKHAKSSIIRSSFLETRWQCIFFCKKLLTLKFVYHLVMF